MIKANELRMGNWVNEAGQPSRIYSIGSGGISFEKINDINISKKTGLVQTTDENRFEPIAITPEILEKCGFEKCNNGIQLRIFESYVFINWFFAKVNEVSEGSPLTLEIDSRRMPLFNILYVHQLQNLYFALTGQELEIKLAE